MENKEIIETEITETTVEEVKEETVDTEDVVAEYPKTISVKVYDEVQEMALDESGITVGDIKINKEDILLVNRYINMVHLKNEHNSLK